MLKHSISLSIFNFGLILLICLSVGAQHQLPGGGQTDEVKHLATGQIAEREIVPMQRHRYAITLAAGQFVKVELEEKEVDAVMALRSPDEINLLDFAEVKPAGGVKTIWAAASVSGIYELRVISYGETKGKGTYRVKVAEIRPATVEEVNFTAGMKIYNENFNGLKPYLQTSELLTAKIATGRKAVEHFRIAKAVVNEARTLWQMGVLSTKLGVSPQTIEFYKDSLELSRSIGDLSGQANTLRDLGDAYEKMGDWDQSFKHLSESIRIARETKRQLTEADVLNQFGEAYARFGDLERATLYFQQASAIYLQFSNVSRSKPLNNLGKVSFANGDPAKAEEFFRQAVEAVRKEEYRYGATKMQEPNYLNNMARAQYALGKKTNAVEALNQALKISVEVVNKSSQADALKFLGRICLDGNETDKGGEHLGQALEIFRSVEDTQNAAETLLLLSKTAAAKNDLELAQLNSEEAIKLIEHLRLGVRKSDFRDAFSANMQDYYGFYVEVLMRRHAKEPGRNFAETALQAAERGRARGFLNLLAESKTNIRDGVDAKLLQKESELKNRLSTRLEYLTKILNGKSKPEETDKLKNEVEQIRVEYEQTQVQIRQMSPRYSAMTQPKTLDTREIQTNLLDDNSVLLEYALGEARSYLWIVSKHNVRTVELPAKQEIEKVARGFYDALTARNTEIKFETAEERDARISLADSKLKNYSTDLSRMIVLPAERYISGKRLIIVADGALQYVPFAALQTGGERYLIEANEIVNLPSASVLATIRKETHGRRLPAKTLAIFADPIFTNDDERLLEAADRNRSKNKPEYIAVSKRQPRSGGDALTRDGFSRLPFTRREADLIGSFVPEKAQEKLLDFAANRRSAMAAELSGFRFLHFATHGFINNENPELSGIVLSMFDEKGATQDGVLRVSDVYGLRLPAEMVVLSGCRTGLGKEIRGEGLIGLTRGFFYAGAKRVTVSLWDVNDESTAELMGQFYREMLGDKKRNPAAALRQAQITMIKDKRWQNPYFWSPFVLQGEPN